MAFKSSGSGGGFVSKGSGGGFKAKVTSGVSETPIVTSGLILHLDAGNPSSYPGSGTTWTDLSGNGNTATLYGSPTYSSADGGSINFGTSNSTASKYALVNLNSGLRPSTTFTEAAWVKLPAGADGIRVVTAVQYGSGGTNSYALFMLGGNALYGLANTTGSDNFWTPGNITLNTWQYISHIYDGTNQKLYVNGVQLGSSWPTTGTQVYDLSNTKLTIGMNYDGPGYDAGINGNELGNLSVVQFYDRALNQLEISQNFNATKSRYGL